MYSPRFANRGLNAQTIQLATHYGFETKGTGGNQIKGLAIQCHT